MRPCKAASPHMPVCASLVQLPARVCLSQPSTCIRVAIRCWSGLVVASFKLRACACWRTAGWSARGCAGLQLSTCCPVLSDVTGRHAIAWLLRLACWSAVCGTFCCCTPHLLVLPSPSPSSPSALSHGMSTADASHLPPTVIVCSARSCVQCMHMYRSQGPRVHVLRVVVLPVVVDERACPVRQL